MSPKVTIIVPCYNESRTISGLLDAIQSQTYRKTEIEVVIADGMSTDGTRELIRSFSNDHPELVIRLVDNPDRIIPTALNRAIETATGELIIRLDAHSIPHPDYVERCLSVLEETNAANVGGVWEIQASGEGWLPRSIAAAAAHPLGAGDARYRTSGKVGEVDTVPFGAFTKEWVDRVGPFDEGLLTNEDYEFNVRLRNAGGVIWFDPSIRSRYFARPDLPSLAKQYARYGYWKVKMLSKHPDSLRIRQLLPPLFVSSVIILGVLASLWNTARILLGVQLAIYGLTIILAGALVTLQRNDPAYLVGFPLAIWTMHLSWGSAFLWSMLTALFGGRREPRKV